MNKSRFVVLAFAALMLIVGSVQADTFEEVTKRGFLRCATGQSKLGFGAPGDDRKYHGQEVDFCKALGAAVFGDSEKAEIVPVSSKTRFTALTSREADVLTKGTTWTYSRDAKLGVDFAAYWFFDGQGFLVSKKLGVKDAKELDGATICISPGTTSEKNVADYFRSNGMSFSSVAIESGAETISALQKGRCDVVTNDISALAGARLKFSNPDEFEVLPNNIAKEPLGVYVRQNDSKWRDIVVWTRNAIVAAEELGITQANADELAKTSKDPRIQRLLGTKGEMGAMLGLSNDWALNVIKAVGNIGEVFERNVGQNTNLKLPRDLNKQWYDGGLMFAPPFR